MVLSVSFTLLQVVDGVSVDVSIIVRLQYDSSNLKGGVQTVKASEAKNKLFGPDGWS